MDLNRPSCALFDLIRPAIDCNGICQTFTIAILVHEPSPILHNDLWLIDIVKPHIRLVVYLARTQSGHTLLTVYTIYEQILTYVQGRSQELVRGRFALQFCQPQST